MKEITKVGMFIEGILIGILFTYSFLLKDFNLPYYPFVIGLICIFIIGLCFQEKPSEVYKR
jgi:hypothetical protein